MRVRHVLMGLVLGVLTACAGGEETKETAAREQAPPPGYLGTAGIEQAMLDTTAYGVTQQGETLWGIYFAPDGTARAAGRTEDGGLERFSGNWRAEDNALCFNNWDGWTILNQCFRIRRQGDQTRWESMETDFVNQAILVNGNPDSL